jgi:hypothetical protein
MDMPPQRTLTVTKEQAATRQVVAAIEAFGRGDYDVATTLAGAAEDMIERAGMHLFGFLMDHPKVQEIPRKEWVRHINQVRDWLKHPSGPPSLEIDMREAAVMIARAATKLEASSWTSTIDDFRLWYIQNADELFD